MDKSILHFPPQDILATLLLRFKRILAKEIHPKGDRLHHGGPKWAEENSEPERRYRKLNVDNYLLAEPALWSMIDYNLDNIIHHFYSHTLQMYVFYSEI